MNDKIKDENKVIIWLNGKDKSHSFPLELSSNIDTIKKLKEAIIYEGNMHKANIDRMLLFSYKAIEIDDLDIPYFTNNQVIYLSIDGQKFSVLNYVYEFEFIKTIKKGGYAEVYLAKNTITNELVSIKKTDLHNFSTEELYNISREAVYLSTLVHKNIIKILNSYTHENCLYNVMEYAQGGELSQLLLNDEPIPEARIKDIFYQIHNAVKFIHSNNITHRDLKPNNILFLDKEQTRIVIIDFGISGICNGMSREVIKAGTLRYVPPEIASGEAYTCSPKIDIWSLGIILYLLHNKEFPFEGNDNDTLDKIVNDPVMYPAKTKIRKTLIPLIEGMLAKNQNERIDTSSSLFDDWYNDESEEYLFFEEKREINPPKPKELLFAPHKPNKGNSIFHKQEYLINTNSNTTNNNCNNKTSSTRKQKPSKHSSTTTVSKIQTNMDLSPSVKLRGSNPLKKHF